MKLHYYNRQHKNSNQMSLINTSDNVTRPKNNMAKNHFNWPSHNSVKFGAPSIIYSNLVFNIQGHGDSATKLKLKLLVFK